MGAPFPKKIFHYIMIFSFCGVFLRLIFIDIRESRPGVQLLRAITTLVLRKSGIFSNQNKSFSRLQKGSISSRMFRSEEQKKEVLDEEA